MTLCTRWFRFACSLAAIALLVPVLARADIVFSLPPEQLARISTQLQPADISVREARAQHDAQLMAAAESMELASAHMLAAKRIAERSNAADFAVEFVYHLEQAATDPAQSNLCHVYLGKIYLAAREYRSATGHLAKVAELQPDLRYLYARALHASGDSQQAIVQGEKALEEFQALMKSGSSPELAESYWLNCLQFLERFEQAEAYLMERLAAGQASAQPELAGLNRNWSQYFLQRHGFKQAIDKALVAWRLEDSKASRDHLVQTVNALGAVPKTIRNACTTSLADVDWDPHLSLMLGSVLCSIEVWDAGLMLLRKAADAEPAQADALNNLAHFLAHRPKADLAEALVVADRLIAVGGGNRMFFETRGQIHCLLQNWEQAREDLETALPELPEHAPLHWALAEVYTQLEEPVKAESHRLLAKKWEQKRATESR